MNKIISFIMCFFMLSTLIGQVTIGNTQASIDCGNSKGGRLLSVINNQSSALQSSTHSTSNNVGAASKAIDGVNTGTFSQGKATKTDNETTPWWEVQLDDVYALESIKLYFPDDVYPNGINNIYILTSRTPFATTSLASEISSPTVKSIHIEGAIPSGTSIPLDFNSAQYVRVQYNGEGILSLLEVDLPGTDTEICGNGKDDDCDGKIDCEDSDCAPTFINIQETDPTCGICNDGEIIIQYGSKDNSRIAVSIYGEDNLEDCVSIDETDPRCLFENLPDGEYNLFISNGACVVEYPNNPVILSSPPGIVTSHCENGGFELNDFTNWEPRWGRVLNEGVREIEWRGRDFIDGRVSLLSAGQDPYTPITFPYLGNYSVRLGNDDTKQIDQLTYCFIVDEDHVDFNFHYALVLEEPSDDDAHDSIEDNPFFQYSISRIIDDVPEPIPNGLFQVISDIENPLFIISDVLSPNEEPIVYTNWNCEEFDLTEFIGDEICIEFIVSDCFLGGHFGYVYIDGICSSEEDAMPNIELNIPSDIFCANQEVIIDGTNSTGFNSVRWEVCQLDVNNIPFNCVVEESISSVLGLFDVGNFYSNLGQSLECGNSYSVNLTLDNSCSEPVSEEIIIDYICVDYEFIYKDILICGTNLQQDFDIMIEGENNCGGDCLYEWSPQPLDDPQLEFPTIEGTRNTAAFKQNYNVKITSPEGCHYQDEVEIFKLPPINLELVLIEDMDLCAYNLDVILRVIRPVDVGLIVLTFDNLNTGEQFDGVLTSGNSNTSFTYRLPESIDKDNPDTYLVQASWDPSFFESDDLLIWGEASCSESITYTPPSDDRYFGDIIYGIPNAFEPGSSNPNNQTFGPLFLDMLNHNVSYGRLRIWDRFGNEVYDKEAFSPLGGVPFDMNELHWDGTNEDGELHNSDNFLWILDLRNCDHPEGLEDNQNFCDCTDEEYLNGGCGSCTWKGSFILIR